MANELEITGIIKYNKSGIKSDLSLSSRVSITGSRVTEIVQDIGTSDSELNLGDLGGSEGQGSPGYIIIENLSEENTVSLKPTSGSSYMISIGARKFAGPFELHDNASAPLAKSSAGSSNVRIIVVEK
jgi:hypothetical protein